MKVISYDCVVIGTGAAGYNAACRLKSFGRNVCIVTEAVGCGTSRNTGSDKQTYYKLGLSGDSPDSVRAMAQNLFAGGSVDGDNALCEAALSTRCFMNLCELGVPFPVNRYGEYIGYKTDHDPFERATSAGPLTSKFMTEALQKSAQKLNVPVFSGYLAVEILKSRDCVCGLLCIEKKSGELIAFHCGDIVMATGGPAGIYADSVYPECHTGSTGLALLAGAEAQSLTEWQYGLASVRPRWNVSGTYMQVLPRFVSVDDSGREHEFLADYFSDVYEALSFVFLKGYQWPFDSRKVLSGSSVIDLLVYRECVLKKRRVYLDYTANPFGLTEIDYRRLSKEAYQYLEKAQALFGTPIERLMKMNAPAVELYKGKGLDLSKEYLEIALCAQHSNGGISVDCWWQTKIRGLFAAGECAGTHGVTRPGGSALNAGQVGSLRAAEYIAAHPNTSLTEEEFCRISSAAAARITSQLEKMQSGTSNTHELLLLARRRMSDNAAAIRNREKMAELLNETRKMLSELTGRVHIAGKEDIIEYFQLKDTLVTQSAVLTAMIDYTDTVGDTRGSALYFDSRGQLRDGLEEMFRFCGDSGRTGGRVQQTVLTDGGFHSYWRQVRPIPKDDDFFENVWRQYRENKNIF